MLNLKPQYFGSLMQKNQLIGIDLDAWKQEKRMETGEEDDRG